MRCEALADGILLIQDCPHPARNKTLSSELVRLGVKSLLVVADDPTPCPLGLPGGLWCYVHPLVDPVGPSIYEQQRISDFVAYERKHGRTVGVWVADEQARAKVCEAARRTPDSDLGKRVSPSRENSVCCRTYHPEGCDGHFVCHASPMDEAEPILCSGAILSKRRLTGLSLRALANQGTWGDPPDYFDYVTLARGNCVAPDIVAMSRQAGRDLTPQQADAAFYPGIRFFFRTEQLTYHPLAAWDGIHPIKIRESLELDPFLVAAVAPAQTPASRTLLLQVPAHLSSRMIYLDHHQFASLASWSDAALEAALGA